MTAQNRHNQMPNLLIKNVPVTVHVLPTSSVICLVDCLGKIITPNCFPFPGGHSETADPEPWCQTSDYQQ